MLWYMHNFPLFQTKSCEFSSKKLQIFRHDKDAVQSINEGIPQDDKIFYFYGEILKLPYNLAVNSFRT